MVRSQLSPAASPWRTRPLIRGRAYVGLSPAKHSSSRFSSTFADFPSGRDRGFESTSLQRRVQCEPGFLIRANILFLDSPQINARSAGHLRCCFSQDGDLVKRQFFS
jgi:hypothetical protein